MKVSELYKELSKHKSLYNLQSIDNIASIMERGLLSYVEASKIDHTSIAMEEVQNRRDVVELPNGKYLHEYANLYFTPFNPMLYKRKNENANICILVFSEKVLDLDNVVISDRNASSSYVMFYDDLEKGLRNIDYELVFARYWTDDDEAEYYRKKSIKCAEVLVPDRIPFEYVLGAHVYDEVAKNRMLEAGFDKVLRVNPGLFYS